MIIEKEPPAQEGSGPQSQAPGRPQPCSWTARGSVIAIDYGGHKLKIQTTQGQYTVNLGNVRIVNGSRIMGLALLNLGDVVLVTGIISGPNEVDAQQVRVTRTMAEATNTLPQMARRYRRGNPADRLRILYIQDADPVAGRRSHGRHDYVRSEGAHAGIVYGPDAGNEGLHHGIWKPGIGLCRSGDIDCGYTPLEVIWKSILIATIAGGAPAPGYCGHFPPITLLVLHR